MLDIFNKNNHKIAVPKEVIQNRGTLGKTPFQTFVIIESKAEMERFLMKPDEIPTGSIVNYFKGNKLNILGLDKDKILWPIEPSLTAAEGHTPEETFVLHGTVQSLVERGWKFLDSWMEKLKFGIFVGIILAEMICLFLIFFGTKGAV